MDLLPSGNLVINLLSIWQPCHKFAANLATLIWQHIYKIAVNLATLSLTCCQSGNTVITLLSILQVCIEFAYNLVLTLLQICCQSGNFCFNSFKFPLVFHNNKKPLEGGHVVDHSALILAHHGRIQTCQNKEV